jgi:MFS transporter, UMF1 family
MTLLAPAGPLHDPAERRREQRAWFTYDWANSAYVTTVGTVLFGPYLTAVAETAACGEPGTPEDPCRTDLMLAGIPLSPGAVAPYTVTAASILMVIFLPIVGALADRTPRKRRLLAAFAWVGAAAATAMIAITGGRWLLGIVLLLIGNLCLGCSLVVYDSILNDVASEEERHGVSSRGWALGYLGGGLLLAANLAIISIKPFGLDTAGAVRLCLLSAGLWWGLWTIIPYRRLRDRQPLAVEHVAGGTVREAVGQLRSTLSHVRAYPQTLLFLLAFLFFNDGIQTVIYASSIYGNRELGLSESTLIIAVLLVQFVAFAGALLLGRLAQRLGSKRVIAGSLLVWVGVVGAAFFLPPRQIVPFLLLAGAIGVVLGGSQALSRSLYSLLIPRGREAEYFSLYQACERGTSWFGTLVFGLTFQLTDSYRYAIIAVVGFFLLGLVLLSRVDVRRGIVAAGNEPPAVA